METQLKK